MLIFPSSTLDFFFSSKKIAENFLEEAQGIIEGKRKIKDEAENAIEKDLGKKVYFKDVIGIDEFKDELMEIVDRKSVV